MNNTSSTNNPLIPGNLPTNMLPVGVGPSSSPSIANVPGTNTQAAVAAAALNAMKQAQLSASQQLSASGSNNLPPNTNLNLLGGNSTTNSSGSANAEQQRRQQQEQLLQKQMLMSLTSQTSTGHPLEAHSLKINEYMR